MSNPQLSLNIQDLMISHYICYLMNSEDCTEELCKERLESLGICIGKRITLLYSENMTIINPDDFAVTRFITGRVWPQAVMGRKLVYGDQSPVKLFLEKHQEHLKKYTITDSAFNWPLLQTPASQNYDSLMLCFVSGLWKGFFAAFGFQTSVDSVYKDDKLTISAVFENPTMD